MKIIWEKYKEIFILLAYVAVLAVLFAFIIKPLFFQIQEKRRYAEEKTVEQEITRKKINELPQLKERMDVVKQEDAKLNVFFSQDKALSLIKRLENLAAETGNEISIEIIKEFGINNIETKKTQIKETGIINELPDKDFLLMRLNLDGDFNSTVEFIRKIESMDYFSDIIAVKLSKDENSKEVDAGSVSTFFSSNVTEKEPVVPQDINKLENPLKIVLDIVFYQEK